MKQKTHEEFLIELSHKNISLKEKSYYINNRIKLTFICNKCNHIWTTKPVKITNGCGCPKCANNLKSNNSELSIKLKNRNILIHKDSPIYKNNKSNMLFECTTCNYIWTSKPNYVLSGCGCPKCANKIKWSIEDLNKEIINYNIIIDKTETKYTNNKTKILFNCLICGHKWSSKTNNILTYKKCPKCTEKTSSGEEKIKSILDSLDIKYIQQHKFDNCKNKKLLPFDFYLPYHNICIELDGEQHFKPIKYFGGEKKLLETKINDTIKNNYCLINNITLLRIPYFEFNEIDIILKKILHNK